MFKTTKDADKETTKKANEKKRSKKIRNCKNNNLKSKAISTSLRKCDNIYPSIDISFSSKGIVHHEYEGLEPLEESCQVASAAPNPDNYDNAEDLDFDLMMKNFDKITKPDNPDGDSDKD